MVPPSRVEAWPALDFETCEWQRPAGNLVATRRERHAAARTSYQSALVPLIAHRQPVVSGAVAAEAEDAVAEIARFDAEMGREVRPYSAVLLRGEAIASSDIEHITSSARNIAMAEELGVSGTNAGVVAANVRAMRRAVDAATTLDRGGILTLHRELMSDDTRHEPGRFRTEPVWIGGFDSTPVGAHFVPPHHRHIEGAIEDLMAFVARTDIGRLTQLAISHAQFETIHPFTDGNGRTGRALMHVMLQHNALVQHGVVPVSAGLLTDTKGYHAALDAYREGHLDPIVSLFTASSLRAVTNSTELVSQVRSVREAWDERVKLRSDSTSRAILDLLLRRPLLTAAGLRQELGVRPTHVPRVMEPLLTAGVVHSARHYASRSSYWWAPEVLEAVDAFAVRAGRRQL